MQQNDRYMTFSISGGQFAVPLSKVHEVIPDTDVTPVPMSPHFLTGIINVRGRIISVISLQLRFGLSAPAAASDASILIIQNKGALLGIKTDSVDSVIQLAGEQLSPPPSYSTAPYNNYTKAVAQGDRQLIVILDSEKLFSFDEFYAGVPSNGPAAAA
ncbi:MAG: purine-binding chemotaxis protein CheW [Proteobacteria bacterium]|nr:purine-binding chemotaxis protein CheW [Pseudomonadota bacterium]